MHPNPDLRFPQMRDELLGHLRSLSDLEYQNTVWVEGIMPAGVEHDELDYALHFLFDDTSLSSDPSQSIGLFLKNETEAEAVSNVVVLLNLVLSKYGTDLSDADYISCPEWEGVVASALRALRVCSEREEEDRHHS